MTAPKLPPLPAALFLAPTELGHNDAAMRAYGEACAAAERERCARIVEEHNPGGSYHIRTVLAAAIRSGE